MLVISMTRFGPPLTFYTLVSALPVTDIHEECGGWVDPSFDSQTLSVHSEPVAPPALVHGRNVT